MAKTSTRKNRSTPAGKKKTVRTASNAIRSTGRRRKSNASRSLVDQPLDLVMQLMPIRGKSGEEQDVADFIVKQLIAAGAKITAMRFDNAHKKTPIDGQVGNLIFKIPGTKSGPRRLLMAHMDTVPICVGCQPVRKGKLVRSADPATALGADDRAGCAVVLNAALRILRQQPDHPPLTFLWTIQEEIGLHGARNLRVGMLGKPALAFNWDGGNPAKLTIGATGGYRMQIDVDGIASHAGNAPEHGVSAIAIASVAIASLQADGWHGLVTKHGRRGSTNVGVVRGGDATNVVTDHVTLRVEARSHDPKFRRQIVQQIEKAFRTRCKASPKRQRQDRQSLLSRTARLRVFPAGPRRTQCRGGQDGGEGGREKTDHQRHQWRCGCELDGAAWSTHGHAGMRTNAPAYRQRSAQRRRVRKRLRNCLAAGDGDRIELTTNPIRRYLPSQTKDRRMKLDDELCLCFHVTKRKVVTFIRLEKPARASQLSECYGAGTGCGWCRPFLRDCSSRRRQTRRSNCQPPMSMRRSANSTCKTAKAHHRRVPRRLNRIFSCPQRRRVGSSTAPSSASPTTRLCAANMSGPHGSTLTTTRRAQRVAP